MQMDCFNTARFSTYRVTKLEDRLAPGLDAFIHGGRSFIRKGISRIPGSIVMSMMIPSHPNRLGLRVRF